MLPVRLSKAAASMPALLAVGACILSPNSAARAEDPAATCQDGLAVLSSRSRPGAMRRCASSWRLRSRRRRAGPDYAGRRDRGQIEPTPWRPALFLVRRSRRAGRRHVQAKLTRANAAPECREVSRDIVVQRKQPAAPRAAKSVWPLRDGWTRANENLYAAWIEKLFDAPLDQELSWKAMDQVLHDPSRNILFNHLGLRETRRGRSFNPTAPTSPISCAPISPSRWGCHSAIRNARAATARGAEMRAMVERGQRRTGGDRDSVCRGPAAGRANRLLRHVLRPVAAPPTRRTVAVPRRPKGLVRGSNII